MITVGTIAKIRRMRFREYLSIREITRKTGLARNTVREWLRQPQVVEPAYPNRGVVSTLHAYAETLSVWLKTNQHRGKREHRTVHAMYQKTDCDGLWRRLGR